MDGVVVEGLSAVDESMLTGESPSRWRRTRATRWCGATINKHGLLPLPRRPGWARDTVLAQIIRLVEEAQGSKAPIQRLADRVAAVIFVPTVISHRPA